jgi:hypothetical protein
VSNYDAFTHLSQSLFKKHSDLFAMLTAYLDDSGTHASSFVVAVAGYASTTLDWQSFGSEWRRLLRKEKISVMHMAELQNLQGQFSAKRGWTIDRREKLVARAAKIIGHRTRTAVGHAVIRADWEKAVPEYLKKLFGGPYGWCASECVALISNWKKRNDIKGGLDFVFEAGTDGQGQIQEMMMEIIKDPELNKHYGLHGYSFHDKTLLPLQAADMLAYEVYKEAENYVVQYAKRNVRPPLVLLRGRHSSRHFSYADERYLREWIAHNEKRYGTKEDERGHRTSSTPADR